MSEDKYIKAAGEMFLECKRREQAQRKAASRKRLEAVANEAAGYIHAKARGRKYFFM